MSCHKHTYPDKKAALSARNLAFKRRRNHPEHLRAYHCESCNGWHLTHRHEAKDHP